MASTLDADYFVCGAGAMGMAFVDSLIKEKKVKVVMIDKHSQPGGHWNDAYPYVRLHQPSKFYGVNSKKLERSNNPLELASRNEVLAYYESVMENFIESGQVQFFPMCISEDFSSRTFHSLVAPQHKYKVSSHAKIVDATYMDVQVPSISEPTSAGRYEVEEGVELVPLNALTNMRSAHQRYVIVGAGKTGMDAVLWLLNNNVNPEYIHWIMPQDSWMYVREVFAPELPDRPLDALKLATAGEKAQTQYEAMVLLEEGGLFTRLDNSVKPTKYKCATVSLQEVEQLRRVRNLIRLGRVARLKCNQIVLAKGIVEMDAKGTLYVDCSTNGLKETPPVPVFQGDRIFLQSVVQCQQVFSAALIGYLESLGDSDAQKNSFCVPVPHPESVPHVFTGRLQTELNRDKWKKDSRIWKFVGNSRLHGLDVKDEVMFANTWQKLKFVMLNLHNLPMLMKAERNEKQNSQRLAKL